METSVRRLVRDRAGKRCEYCGLAEAHVYIPHHIDHIRPKQHGGDDSPLNLALACQGCNLKKGSNLAGIDPESGMMVALFNPREQTWLEHFVVRGALRWPHTCRTGNRTRVGYEHQGAGENSRRCARNW